MQRSSCPAVTLGRYGGINEDFVLVDGWGECEAEGSQEMVEVVGEALVEAVELRTLWRREGGVAGIGIEKAGGQRRVDAVEELQEDQADRIALGRQAVAAGAGQLLDKALGAELGEVVAEGGQAVLLAAVQPRAAATCGWISPVLKVLAAGDLGEAHRERA